MLVSLNVSHTTVAGRRLCSGHDVAGVWCLVFNHLNMEKRLVLRPMRDSMLTLYGSLDIDWCRRLAWSLLDVSLELSTALSPSPSRIDLGNGETGEPSVGKKYESSLAFIARFFSDAAVTMLLLLPMLVTLSLLDVINCKRSSRRAACRLVECARVRPEREPTGGAGPLPIRRYSELVAWP